MANSSQVPLLFWMHNYLNLSSSDANDSPASDEQSCDVIKNMHTSH